ncbi:diadenosine tetraphosphatase [Pelistega indica]|uniref:Bis(5'-nucleosyl)-tetraphosphatase, symmetrical n=1 Tax=Pelistega indica TaxID=1414851 RepID=V8G8Y7_9BURK|nr:symmetrical bis(5'-nucleosyl)-tetraphosphatase [Pelistega indica]ETD72162.1 diadenosine tetraphosphatase [Pelistega indica]
MQNSTKNPTIWAIGDIQGCCDALDELLMTPELQEDPNAQLWFAGDLINRGPNSLKTLRTIMALGSRAKCVLGNHDLHLLAVYAGIRRENKSDTIDEILLAPDAEEIINWLRQQPLAYYDADHLMVHAGVIAKWDVKKTLKLAEEVSSALRSKNWQKYLAKMYGNEPNRWKESLTGSKRRRVIINALTRMRMCFPDGSMEFGSKEAPSLNKSSNLMPWFEVPNRKTEKTTIIFGHWSTLGLLIRKHLLSLDTGCVWGGKLSAIRLHDRKLVQIDCKSRAK